MLIQVKNALRGAAVLGAVAMGGVDLVLAWLTVTPDSFHLHAAPPGPVEHLIAGLLAALAAALVLGAVAASNGLPWRRRGLLLIAGGAGLEALWALTWLLIFRPNGVIAMFLGYSVALSGLSAWLWRDER